MRVTIVSRIYRPEPSAASLFLGAVADQLMSDGHEVDVITAAPPRDRASLSRGERIRTFPVLRDRNGYVRGIVQYLSFDLPLVFRLLGARRPDVVLVEPPPTTGAVVRVICALRRIPYVYDAADIWSDAAKLESVSGIVVGVLRMLEGFALRGAAHAVTISPGVAERIRALTAKHPVAVSVTGFGADVQAFRLAVEEPQPLFVYAGSYAPAHGADVLVGAFTQFLQTHPGYVMRFIGNGVERPAVEARAAQLGISENIQYLDPVAPEELLPHLGAARASLATIKPGTGYEYAYASKVFSSFAAGCPVIFAGPGPTAELVATANEEVRAGVACAYDEGSIAWAMREFADQAQDAGQRAALSAWTAREHSLAAVAERVARIVSMQKARRR